MAVIYAIEEINRSPEILPNLTLGFHVVDSCASMIKALQGTLTILSRKTEPVPNYSCDRNATLVGFVGEMSSAITLSIGQLLGVYKYPQISYGTHNPIFSDKSRFPSFYRTVPSDQSHYAGITQMLRHFGWRWVGILASEDDSGEKALQQLMKAVSDSGGCVEFFYMLPSDVTPSTVEKFFIVINNLHKVTAKVIIVHCSGLSTGLFFMREDLYRVPKKMWIATLSTSFFSEPLFHQTLTTLNGSLAFSTKKGGIIGFQEFLYNVNPSIFPNDATLDNLWQNAFKCRLENNHDEDKSFSWYTTPCSGNETLWSLGQSRLDVSNLRYTYSVYTAVLAFAHALHAMHASHISRGTNSGDQSLHQEHTYWKVNRYLQKTQFKTALGDEIHFDEYGDLQSKFEILNHVYFPNKTSKSSEVGSFDPYASPGHQFAINEDAILWHSEDASDGKVPHSSCSKSCEPGYWKVPIERRPTCCYTCLQCAEGEFSNNTDMENCKPCPDDQWPNARKDSCVQRATDYLSYGDSLGASLATFSVLFSIATAAVLVVFIHHRNTAIVKANNRDLSYALLVSLMCAFLCSLLFIGQPVTWTCLTQQAAFGIIFTVAVSCVLAKTIIVVIAFNATKPGSRFSSLLGAKMAGSVVLLCTMGEVVICMIWLLTSPPHPHGDTRSETGKIILLCDPGLVGFFYLVIGYMGLLAFASFTVAFLARNLPATFNEAQHITFSMLVFCSVWVSFIPAYLSTKGRYMVAVEIFAMLVSSSGLLGFIFIPKCYIIVFRPELNTREYLADKIRK